MSDYIVYAILGGVIWMVAFWAGYSIGVQRTKIKPPKHIHAWGMWEDREAVKTYVRRGQQFEIDVAMQLRRCSSCGIVETRSIAT